MYTSSPQQLPQYGLIYADSMAGLAIKDVRIFQLTHSHFTILRVRYQKCHGYGSKLWHFWVVTHRVLVAKCGSYWWKEIYLDFTAVSFAVKAGMFSYCGVYVLGTIRYICWRIEIYNLL